MARKQRRNGGAASAARAEGDSRYDREDDGYTTHIQFFDSIGEFQSHVAKLGNVHGGRSDSWHGHESYEDALRNLVQGRLEVVPRAEALLEQLSGDSIELALPVWDSAVVGAFPNVPAYLSGVPDCMMLRSEVQSDQAPLKVFASICVSAGLNQQMLEKRGIAILALCQKLTAVRPVELWIYADVGNYSNSAQIPVVKVETSPLDLSTATYSMTAAGFLRHLCFCFAHPHGFTGGWAWGGQPTNAAYQKRLRKVLGASEDDLVIYGGYVCDPLIDQPVEWINAQVAKYTTQGVAEDAE